jgi:hypothetical protein
MTTAGNVRAKSTKKQAYLGSLFEGIKPSNKTEGNTHASLVPKNISKKELSLPLHLIQPQNDEQI